MHSLGRPSNGKVGTVQKETQLAISANTPVRTCRNYGYMAMNVDPAWCPNCDPHNEAPGEGAITTRVYITL
jgi:hypothetical protein